MTKIISMATYINESSSLETFRRFERLNIICKSKTNISFKIEKEGNATGKLWQLASNKETALKI